MIQNLKKPYTKKIEIFNEEAKVELKFWIEKYYQRRQNWRNYQKIIYGGRLLLNNLSFLEKLYYIRQQEENVVNSSYYYYSVSMYIIYNSSLKI